MLRLGMAKRLILLPISRRSRGRYTDVAFFTSVVGLHETARSGASVYLRAWGDYERHTLKLTGHTTSGLGSSFFRPCRPEYGDSAGHAFDYVDGWLPSTGRF